MNTANGQGMAVKIEIYLVSGNPELNCSKAVMCAEPF